MEKIAQLIYQDDVRVSFGRRVSATLIDMLIFSIIVFLTMISGTAILKSQEYYQTRSQIIEEKRIALYQIEEEAKVYEFVDNEDGRYLSPRPQSETFEDYLLQHILLAYSKNSNPFTNLGLTIENPKNLLPASYENDQIAYFYARYVPLYNNFQGRNNDIVDLGGLSGEAYFYKQLKAHSSDVSFWNFSENSTEFPYLSSAFAADLYKYLKSDNSYQIGLSNYNRLGLVFQSIWKEEANLIVNSGRFQDEYKIYLSNYEDLAITVSIIVSLSFLLTWLLTILLPMLIFKNGETFGKKILNLRIVDVEGYPLSTSKKIGHIIFSFFLTIGWTALPAYFAGGANSGLMFPFMKIGNISLSIFHLLAFSLLFFIVNAFLAIFSRAQTGVNMMLKTALIDYRYHVEVKDVVELDVDKNSEETNHQN